MKILGESFLEQNVGNSRGGVCACVREGERERNRKRNRGGDREREASASVIFFEEGCEGSMNTQLSAAM